MDTIHLSEVKGTKNLEREYQMPLNINGICKLLYSTLTSSRMGTCLLLYFESSGRGTYKNLGNSCFH